MHARIARSDMECIGQMCAERVQQHRPSFGIHLPDLEWEYVKARHPVAERPWCSLMNVQFGAGINEALSPARQWMYGFGRELPNCGLIVVRRNR